MKTLMFIATAILGVLFVGMIFIKPNEVSEEWCNNHVFWSEKSNFIIRKALATVTIERFDKMNCVPENILVREIFVGEIVDSTNETYSIRVISTSRTPLNLKFAKESNDNLECHYDKWKINVTKTDKEVHCSHWTNAGEIMFMSKFK